MQDPDLVPSELAPASKHRRAIEIVEPQPPSRWRFLRMTWFLMRLVFRSAAALIFVGLQKSRYTPAEQARFLRSFMEQMGGLMVKTGQIIALRRDLFSQEFCDELARLQDRVRGFPGRIAREIIETELGVPIDSVFSDFEETPLAAASVGQVHCARLRTSSVEVVVKVQRPDIAQNLNLDFGYIRKLVWLLERLGIAPQFRWADMYDELSEAILEELDYELEAATLRRMRKNLRGQHIYVPKVYHQHSTGKVLVMERVRGVYMSEFIQTLSSDPARVRQWLEDNEISAREVGQRLLFSHWKQLFEDNLYHCDLHPGNILLMRRNHVTLIDFGSCGTTNKTLLTRYLMLYKAIAARDYAKVADLFLLFPQSLPNRDLSPVKDAIVQTYRQFEPLTKIKTLPYHKKSIGTIAGVITKIIGDAEIPFPWDILRSLRSDLTLDSALMILLPDVNYPKLINKYLRKHQQRQRKAAMSMKTVRPILAKYSKNIDVPIKLAENVYFEGEYLRRRARKYAGYISKAAMIGRYLFRGFTGGCFFASFASVLLLIYQKTPFLHIFDRTRLYPYLQSVPRLGTVLWVVLAVAALYLGNEMAVIMRILENPEPSKTGGDRR